MWKRIQKGQIKDRVAGVYSDLVGLSVVAHRRYVHGRCFDPRKWDRWENYFDKIQIG
jgi:hypothetical protein